MAASPTIVIDSRSYTTVAGFAGDQRPSCIIPSVVGRPKERATGNLNEWQVGDDATSNADVLNIKRPIEQGLVTNWDDVEKLWQHVMVEKLKVPPEKSTVLLTEPTSNPKVNRERTLMMMFETFNTASAYIAPEEVLSLYASGRMNGVVLNIGDAASQAVPVYEGYVVSRTVEHVFLAGQNITYHLMKLLNEKGYSFTTKDDVKRAQDIKEKHCYVALDFEEESKQATQQRYTLPDSQSVSLTTEALLCPEALFQPQLAGEDCRRIPEVVKDAINKCETSKHQALYGNILLSGGTSRFRGFSERIQKEMSKVSPEIEVDVIDPAASTYAAYIGGSILASLPTFQQMWITKEQYDEHGPGIVHTKCL